MEEEEDEKKKKDEKKKEKKKWDDKTMGSNKSLFVEGRIFSPIDM